MNSVDPNTENYYELLSLAPDVPQEEIRKQYHKLAFALHPDKTENQEDVFSKVAQAYSVLNDPVSRALYNIKVGIVKDSVEERKRINAIKRKDAEAYRANAQTMFLKNREEEMNSQGVIILEALYGDITVDDNVDTSCDSVGRCIDVTVPLQCSVRGSALVIYGGVSKSYLEGFYDPNVDNSADNILYVRYRFLNKLHECIVRDCDELVLPLPEHIMEGQEDCDLLASETDAGSESDSEFSGEEDYEEARERRRREKKFMRMNAQFGRNKVQPRAQIIAELRAVKARRRRNLFFGLSTAAVLIGLYFAQKWKWVDLRKYIPVAACDAWNKKVCPYLGDRYALNVEAIHSNALKQSEADLCEATERRNDDIPTEVAEVVETLDAQSSESSAL